MPGSRSHRPHPLALVGLVAAWTALMAWAVSTTSGAWGDQVSEVIGTVVLAAGLVVGVLVWWLHPDRRFGPVLVVIHMFYLLNVFQQSTHAVLFTVGLMTSNLVDPLLAWLFLAYPEGRLPGRLDRTLIAFNAVFILVHNALSVFEDPQRACASCPENLALVRSLPALVELEEVVAGGIFIGIAAAILAILVVRFKRASSVRRRILAPVTVPVVIMSGAAVVRFLIFVGLGGPDEGSPVVAVLDLAAALAFAFLPVGLLLGLMLERRRRARVGALVVELSELASADRLEPALARTLGDPSLTLGMWDPDQHGYVRPSGEPLDLPDDDDPDRAVTHLGSPGQPLGVLVHDPALRHDPGLIGAVRAAAQLAVDNERLNVELLDQLHELEASRARIATAADEAASRIERDLHDGAQQRLLSLAMGLRIAQITADPDTRRELEALASELDVALRELRELTRGIHPSLLTDRGLPAALRSLADRAVIPVILDVDLDGRLPSTVESTAYYVVAEGITNAAKHASAERVHVHVHLNEEELVVRVSDDGVGGARAEGSGLQGLADRVAAVEGSFEVSSAVGSGTTLTARLPVRDPASAVR